MGSWLVAEAIQSTQRARKKKKKKEINNSPIFLKKQKQKNKAIKNKNPKIIRLSEPGDVYFIGFDLLVEMAEAPRHLLIKN